MCDTSAEDTQIVRITEELDSLTAERRTVAAIKNPHSDIVMLISVIDSKIQRLNLRLTTVNQAKFTKLALYNAQCACRDNVGATYGSGILNIFNKHVN